jgi:hypothetical protein
MLYQCGYGRNGLVSVCLSHRCCNAPWNRAHFLGERDVASLWPREEGLAVLHHWMQHTTEAGQLSEVIEMLHQCGYRRNGLASE